VKSEVVKSEVAKGSKEKSKTRFLRLSAGHSGARHRHPRVTVEKSTDIHGLIVYKSWICEKVLKKMISLVC
jgi:hypothetical protein